MTTTTRNRLHDGIFEIVRKNLGFCPTSLPKGSPQDIAGLVQQVEEQHTQAPGYDREKVIGILMAAGQAQWLSAQFSDAGHKSAPVAVALRGMAYDVAQSQGLDLDVVESLRPMIFNETLLQGKRQAACYIAGLLLMSNEVEPVAALLDHGVRIEPDDANEE